MFQKYNLFIPLYKIINWYTQRFSFPQRGWKFFRRLLKATATYNRYFIKKLPQGMRMYTTPAEHIQQQIFWYGYYEKEAILTWEAFLQPGGVCLDIGANTGYYSLIASPRATSVYAFEPSSENRAWLQKNAALNKFQNIIIEAQAAGNKNGTGTLFHAGGNNTGMTGLQPPENYEGFSEAVQITTVDDWAMKNMVEQIDLVKIDVEGSEMEVLKGMTRSLDRWNPALFIEVINELLSKYNSDATAVFDFLHAKGYKAFKIVKSCQLLQINKPGEAYTLVFIHEGKMLPASIRAGLH